MKFFLSLLTLGLLFLQTAHARLGETIEEINKRYGAVIVTNAADGLIVRTYSFKDYKVQVRFKDSKSIYEAILPSPARAMTDEECESLRDNIAGKGNWTRREGSVSTVTIWQKSDGLANAIRNTTEDGSALAISSKDYDDYVLARELERRKKEKAKADGF